MVAGVFVNTSMSWLCWETIHQPKISRLQQHCGQKLTLSGKCVNVSNCTWSRWIRKASCLIRYKQHIILPCVTAWLVSFIITRITKMSCIYNHNYTFSFTLPEFPPLSGLILVSLLVYLWTLYKCQFDCSLYSSLMCGLKHLQIYIIQLHTLYSLFSE